MAPQDITKTAILNPFGLFKNLFMPFDLHNVAQTFQRFTDSLSKHLPFLFICLDDHIIASHSLEEHYDHENGLQLNPAKCVFATLAV
jgi:hypothetical protein